MKKKQIEKIDLSKLALITSPIFVTLDYSKKVGKMIFVINTE